VFAAGRRERLTIATKFGIDPAAPGAAGSVAKGLVRLATRRSRRALAFARRHSGRTVRRGAFDPERARASLRVSLEKLRTTHLDAFLLHDCGVADWRRPDLQEALAEMLAAGTIAACGPATTAPQVRAILAGGPRPRLAQFDLDLLAGPEETPGGAAAGALPIAYGVFSRGLPPLRSWLGDPERRAERSAELDLDLGAEEVLGDLMLATALRRNRGGVVLVSASSPRRLQRNAACATASPFEPAQLDRFESLLRAAGSARPSEAAA